MSARFCVYAEPGQCFFFFGADVFSTNAAGMSATSAASPIVEPQPPVLSEAVVSDGVVGAVVPGTGSEGVVSPGVVSPGVVPLGVVSLGVVSDVVEALTSTGSVQR